MALFSAGFVMLVASSIVALSSGATPLSNPRDKEILLSIKGFFLQYKYNSNVSTVLRDWLPTANNTCEWSGIECGNWQSQGSRVTSINLDGAALSGPIPPMLANLDALSTLRFASNNLSGTIPPSLQKCTNLRLLNLANNSISGTIPPELSELHNLEHLNLSYNKLTGEIPSALFSNCSQLRVVDVSDNQIEGRLPVQMQNCQNLRRLHLPGNRINGSLIPQLAMLKDLQSLVLGRNNLTGNIPGSLINSCGNLEELDLSHNNLSGNFPAINVNCSSLASLYLEENHLTGKLPEELYLLTKLHELTLGKNRFAGFIPPEWGRLQSLKLLAIDNNNLSGGIPSSLGQIRELKFLLLHKNNLSGGIPLELGSLARLRILDLNNNKLSGAIPPQLGNISSLRWLFLASNSLTGHIPPEICDLTQLQALDVGENKLSGEIPRAMNRLQRLLWLSIADNNLEGRIHPEIVNCSSLVWLNAANNRLSGEIPQDIGFIGGRAAETFELNKRNPPVLPRHVGGCSAMARWIPQDSKFIYATFRQDRCQTFWNTLLRGEVAAPICAVRPESGVLAYLQLSGNNLSGPIPESLANYSRLGGLFLGQNRLSGNIPESLSGLPLVVLNISRNEINGSISAAVGRLTCLTTMDLSSNNLEGIIPASLGNLTSLSSFNASYNVNLRGPVPTGGQFSTFTPTSYLGDLHLCLDPLQGTRQDDGSSTLATFLCHRRRNATQNTALGSQSESSNRSVRIWAIGGVGIAMAVTIILIASCCLWRASAGKPSVLSSTLSRRISLKRVGILDYRGGGSVRVFGATSDLKQQHLTYADIVKATDHFNEAHCIGRGGHGAVYRAELEGQVPVAIKRLCHDNLQAEIEFLAEMQTVGKVKHSNVVPLLGCCIWGNQRLLIYKLMTNGSLEDWLYSKPPAAASATILDWPRRLRIATDSAMALRFLHHEFSSVIIHRDIKASNILLDENFNGFIADFGLARRQGVEETHVSTIIAGTLGYVPPEYSHSWKATTKGDVYSFGVILFELATGMRAMEQSILDEFGGGLVDWARVMVSSGRAKQIVDPRILSSTTASAWDNKQLLRFVALAYNCTHETPHLRPSIIEVAAELQEIRNCMQGIAPQSYPDAAILAFPPNKQLTST